MCKKLQIHEQACNEVGLLTIAHNFVEVKAVDVIELRELCNVIEIMRQLIDLKIVALCFVIKFLLRT